MFEREIYETAFTNATFVTMVDDVDTADALLVDDDGRIAYIGDAEEARRLADGAEGWIWAVPRCCPASSTRTATSPARCSTCCTPTCQVHLLRRDHRDR
ncbi:MAG: hypothetical protein ACLTDR_06645 [Adlercreutzia equolifaciens]